MRNLAKLLIWVAGISPLGFACAPSPAVGGGGAGAGGSGAAAGTLGGIASGGRAVGGAPAGGAGASTSGGEAGSPAGSGGVAAVAGTGNGGASAGSGNGGGGGASGGTGGATACAGATTLKDAGSCTNRLIGVALTNRHLDEPEFAAAALQFNYVTPEDEMKWDVTEPQQGTFTFAEGDAIVEFAEANGMKVKGHTLVWHNQLPSWLDALNEAQLRAALKAHIEGVMAHYAGRVIAWDVVNEAFDDDGSLRSSIWSQKLGQSFIEDAFRFARAADPNVKLYYNDYDIESAYAKADSVYEMVKDFKQRGVPIDGVGMQMHTRTTDEDPPVPELIVNLDRLLALGVEVVLSEMDVRYCADGTDEKQKKRFHDIVAACVARSGCGAITIWGITDRYSFLNDRTDLQCAGSLPPRPLLWNDDYQKKPSFDGVMDALLGR
ncbi:MAG: cex [Polyangiaceae bacterium]|nr:cex [Polyangiaceae bacterium]